MAAVAFHPSEFIAEEMQARGWGRDDLARHMGGDFSETRMSLEFYLEVGPTQRGIRVGQHTAMQLAVAFGTSPDLWLNLEASWLAAHAEQERG